MTPPAVAFSKAIFLNICDEASMKVDFHCNDSGKGLLCARACSPVLPFLQCDCKGLQCWIDPPADQLGSFLEHYAKCKACAPHTTSALVVVPSFMKAKLKKQLASFRLVKEYPARTPLYCVSSQEGTQVPLPGVDWPVLIYYDAPAPQHSLGSARSGGLKMQFEGTFGGRLCRVLFDSGASATFVNSKLVHDLHMSIQSCPSYEVTVANGDAIAVAGSCTEKLQVQCFSTSLTAMVCDLGEDFDVILGQDWLAKHNAELCFDPAKVVLSKGNRVFVVTERDSARQTPVAAKDAAPSVAHFAASRETQSGQPILLSALQFKTAVKNGSQYR